MKKYILACQFNYTPKDSTKSGVGINNYYCQLESFSEKNITELLEKSVKPDIEKSYPKDTKIGDIIITFSKELDE